MESTWEIIESNNFYITMKKSFRSSWNADNMKEFDITDKMIDILEKIYNK